MRGAQFSNRLSAESRNAAMFWFFFQERRISNQMLLNVTWILLSCSTYTLQLEAVYSRVVSLGYWQSRYVVIFEFMSNEMRCHLQEWKQDSHRSMTKWNEMSFTGTKNELTIAVTKCTTWTNQGKKEFILYPAKPGKITRPQTKPQIYEEVSMTRHYHSESFLEYKRYEITRTII